MHEVNRRALMTGAAALGAVVVLEGCVATGPAPQPVAALPLVPTPTYAYLGANPDYAAIYGAVLTEPYPVPAIDLTRIDPAFLRTEIAYPTPEPPGTIVIDPQAHYLYFVEGGGRAIRYGVGVGRQGFSWSGDATIRSKQHWPDWYPPKEMFERQPELLAKMTQLQSGTGMAGGPGNPLGARAMYLWQGNKDTLYRIHGTVEPWTIGTSVSSGCIRMINQDAMDLYERTAVGAKVVVLPAFVG
jgi:lipoprotein-anchoring transpeptidase ErfK/SrfK